MAIKPCRVTPLIAATAIATSIGAAPAASAATGSATTGSAQWSCVAQTEASTACQWPSSASAETNNTDGAPYQSHRPVGFGPR
jgi:hypothetical protein